MGMYEDIVESIMAMRRCELITVKPRDTMKVIDNGYGRKEIVWIEPKESPKPIGKLYLPKKWRRSILGNA
jgi:hypothetical protein